MSPRERAFLSPPIEYLSKVLHRLMRRLLIALFTTIAAELAVLWIRNRCQKRNVPGADQ